MHFLEAFHEIGNSFPGIRIGLAFLIACARNSCAELRCKSVLFQASLRRTWMCFAVQDCICIKALQIQSKSHRTDVRILLQLFGTVCCKWMKGEVGVIKTLEKSGDLRYSQKILKFFIKAIDWPSGVR